ncbi:PIN-like domain-containing protein [Saccharopolyspora sp. NPDC049426]|uniref:PIN-like domain-containing protein n=1 Tax=Saccharopolyspora sp. NPDC049426 TaxID=3155652 RepID=UPI00342031B9
MTDNPEDRRRLTVDFAGLLNQRRVPPERFFQCGLVVLDANVLLDLYRLTPEARAQVLDAFTRVGTRLWVPHQAATEFSRNRKRVVEDRMSSFRKVRRLLQTAEADAVAVLESAVSRLQELRDVNGTTRAWDLRAAELDQEHLASRLDGLMVPALEELSTLEEEHDLHPKDMQQVDAVLSQVDQLLAGRIGPAFRPEELRALVEEAHAFRFPNEIPPGFRDASKETPLRAAGDYLLWRQTIDRAVQEVHGERLVMLITKDFKSDWWELDSKRRPRGPLPELVQEMRDLADSDLLLISLKDFIEGARKYLSSTVSDETLEQLREASGDVESLLPAEFREPSSVPDLQELPPLEFERLIRYLLIQMGYNVEVGPSLARPYDFWLTAGPEMENVPAIVEVKRYRRPVPSEVVYQLIGAVRHTSARSAMLITSSSFAKEAQWIAEAEPIELIDGKMLVELLAGHGIQAQIGGRKKGD